MPVIETRGEKHDGRTAAGMPQREATRCSTACTARRKKRAAGPGIRAVHHAQQTGPRSECLKQGPGSYFNGNRGRPAKTFHRLQHISRGYLRSGAVCTGEGGWDASAGVILPGTELSSAVRVGSSRFGKNEIHQRGLKLEVETVRNFFCGL